MKETDVTLMAYRDWRRAEAASDPLLERRLGLFSKILRSPRERFGLQFEEHGECEAFGGSVRGRLCQHLAQ
ncbi:MAG TPA: hypothetical protein VK899_11530 [Gemmatimonadales bacterium]|nr:hypothetical protein [Gemmatimonadales bacterium]